jgi:hypothetical protein
MSFEKNYVKAELDMTLRYLTLSVYLPVIRITYIDYQLVI